MNRIPRKVLAGMSFLAGGVLIFFEVWKSSRVWGESGFWIFVGGLLMVLALVELMSKGPGDRGEGEL